MPTQSCAERLSKGGCEAFLYALPGILLAALGWIAFLVGFGWLNDKRVLFDAFNTESIKRGILAEYYLMAISPAVYFIILTVYMLTGMWAVGIVCQIAATLVMVVAGGIAYTTGIIVALQFETERVLSSATESPTLAEPEIYITVLFAGSVQLCIGMVYNMTLIPVVTSFHHKHIFDDPYAQPGDNTGRVFVRHCISSLCTLPATLLTVLGWVAFVVGFGWLNQQDPTGSILEDTPHTSRWILAGFYILAVSPPVYFILYSLYMLIGNWALGLISQFGATVVTVAAGAMVYAIWLANITLLVENGLSTNTALREQEIYWIVAFAGALVVCIGMGFSNALVPAMSSLCHNKPLEIGSQSAAQSPQDHEMTKRNPYMYSSSY